MRCPRCGNENPDQNRFCGMCGGTLLSAPEAPPIPHKRAGAAATPAPAKEAPASRAPVSEPSRRAPVVHDTPPISGPSFLGLNDPGPRKRAGLSIDPEDATSRDLDYLLEDEGEQHSSSGAGKFLLIVVALALAVGLGYLRWKNQGFAWLHSTAKPPAATQPANDAISSSPAPGSPGRPAAQPAQPPPSDAAPANISSPTPPAPVNAAPSEAPTSPAAADSSKPAEGTASAPANTDEAPAAAPKDSATAAKPPSATDSAAASDTTDEPKPEPAPLASKPPAETKPAAALDPVAEAQKYLYGRGVRQDCDRGMRYLKPAANQGNPKAMIEMGALYSAGLCTPHDLPTAYRWFARALRRDPDNEEVQADLKKLWGEMTQPERQLAIKLTQ
jgi:hypothetical protein